MDTKYIVTGVDRRGKRFVIASSIFLYAMSINLWKGSVWEVKEGKRVLIKRVHNY